MDPEEGVPSTGQDQGRNRGGWLWPVYRVSGSQNHEPVPDTPPLTRLSPLSHSCPVKRQQESSPPEPSWLGLLILQDPSQSDQKTSWGHGVLRRGGGGVILTSDPCYFISWCSCFTPSLENTSPVWWITKTRVESIDKDTGKKLNWKYCCNAIAQSDETGPGLPTGWELIHSHIVLRHDSTVSNYSVGKMSYLIHLQLILLS